MNIQTIQRDHKTMDDRLKACRQFFHQHGTATVNVSALLGGRPGVQEMSPAYLGDW